MKHELSQDRNHNILTGMNIVKKIAYQMIIKMPDHVSLEDLIQAGTLGLIDAVDHYSAEKGASFFTYAAIRIRGSILDELRKGDWAPRSVYRQSRDIQRTIQQIEAEMQGPCTTQSIAQKMGLSREELDRGLQDMNNRCVLAYDAFSVEDFAISEDVFKKIQGPFEQIDCAEFSYQLQRAIHILPERERTMMVMYFKDDYNLKQIGEFFELSESRASQLISQSLKKVQQTLTQIYQSQCVEKPEGVLFEFVQLSV